MVMGDTNDELKVLGHLEAVGTASQPITFTSTDDSGPSEWSGLVFDGGTGDLRHVTVRYGGDQNSVLLDSLYGSNIVVRNGELHIESGRVSSVSAYDDDYGLYVKNSQVVVSDTLFSSNGDGSGDPALYATGASTVLTITGSTFQNNTGWAARVAASRLHQVQMTDNIFNGNGNKNRVLIIGGSVGDDVRLTAQSGLGGYELDGDLTVPVTATLTVEPGASVMGKSNVELQVLGHLEAVGAASQPITFTSATDSGPEQWTGLVFDGGTGDLRHVTVRYGGWGGNSILPDGGYGSNIAVRSGEVHIESSRVISGHNDYSPDYGLYVENSQVVVSDTLFSSNGDGSGDPALYATGASTILTVTKSTFLDNAGDGIHFASGSAPNAVIINSAIHDNGGEGIDNDSEVLVDARSNWWGDASGPGGEGPGTGDEISRDILFDPWLPLADLDYTFAWDIYDAGDVVAWRDLSWVDTDDITVTVRVGNTPNPGIFGVHWNDWTTFASLPADLSSLPPTRYLEWGILSTTVPDPDDVIVAHDVFPHTNVGGFISGDRTWSAANSPYLVSGNNILINEGTTLYVEPGVTVWFADARSIQVDGALVALGTAAQPITFTSWHVQKQPDDWGVIAFNATAEDALFDGGGNYLRGSALQYVTVEYGGIEYEHTTMGRFAYAVDAPQTTLYVDHCTFRNNGSGGLRSVGGYVTHNTISDNSFTAVGDVYGAGISNSGGGVVAYNTVTGNDSAPSSYHSHHSRGVGIYSAGGGVVAYNTVTGNSANEYQYAYGNGIYSAGGGEVYSNTVSQNRSEDVSSYSYGGGIYSANSGMVFDNTVTDNEAYANGSSYGGGIYSTLDGTVSDNTVTGNEASSGSYSYGGGICSDASAVSHNTVTANTSHSDDHAYGGGIYSTGACTVSNNLVAGNEAYYSEVHSSHDARGGGIHSAGGGAVENNEVRSNSVSGANSYAGGVYISDGSLCSNAIVSNTAQGNVAGVYWVSIAGEMLYNTIAGNTTLSDTGGVYVLAGYPTIHHNGIYANSGYALRNNNQAGDTRLDARYNWWGATDEATLQGLIYEWFDDMNVGFVDYVPYLLGQPNLSPVGINLSGPTAGFVNTAYDFDASVYPIAAILPITYVWRVSESANQQIVTHTLDSLYDGASFTWSATGAKLITVTASNREGAAVVTYTVDVASTSTADAYEVDDACEQASEIATDGSTQLHTFHTDEDVDWAVFTGTAGSTYIVEATTPADSGADISLEIYGDCAGAPQDGQDHAFSPDASLTFDAPSDGPFYLRLADETDAPGGEARTYYLSVRALSQAPDPGVVVLVAGKRKQNDPLQPNIYHVTNSVYRLFLANGYTGDRIYYLAPDTGLDADGDMTPDVDKISNEYNLQQAITQWAVDKVDADHPFTLYMMDHGGYDLFYLNLLTGGPETATPLELNGWLDELEAAAPGVKVNVIYEACHSGSFINEAPQLISKPGRVVIASTGAWPVAYASANGAIFSDAFVAALGRGMSLHSSFAEAKWSVQQAHPDQTPWLDDDGDGVPNEVEDGQEAARRGFAYAGTFGDPQWPPYIVQAVARQAEGTIQAQVQAQEGRVVSSTWALIYSPSYQPPPPGEDMAQEDAPRVELEDNGNGIFTASYDFAEPGAYRVVIYAVDDRGMSAMPREASFEAVNRPPVTPSNPVPADDATDVPTNQVLSWQGGDLDGDPVTYSVAFGADDPPPIVGQVVNLSYDPRPLALDTTYYWAITATDGLSVSVGPLWSFTTAATAPPNQAPYVPNAPTPANGATDVPTNQTLSWQGGDPDGDPVTYTVAFGVDDPPSVVTTRTVANYTPGDLITDTTYYWVITATDGISTVVGSTWHFTTASAAVEDFKIYLPLVVRDHISQATLRAPATQEGLQTFSLRLRSLPTWHRRNTR